MRGGVGCNHATPLGKLIGAYPHVAPTFLPPESRWLWGNGARRDAIGDDNCNCTDIDHQGEKQILQGLPLFSSAGRRAVAQSFRLPPAAGTWRFPCCAQARRIDLQPWLPSSRLEISIGSAKARLSCLGMRLKGRTARELTGRFPPPCQPAALQHRHVPHAIPEDVVWICARTPSEPR